MGILLRYDTERAVAVPRGAAASASPGARVGLLGAGLFATAVLLPALRSAGAAFTAVATASGASAEAVARTFGFTRVAASATEVVTADDIDAVVIATRHDSHAPLVAAALRAAKPCFVEKPLAITEDGLADVLAAMEERPGLVCVGFNRRFAPGVVALHARLASRTSPFHVRYRVNAGRMPEGHWTLDADVGGGRVLGEVCHFVDLISFLAGAAVVRVQCEAAPGDGIAATLRLRDGSTATLDYLCNGASSIPKEHLDLHWEGTSFVLDDFRELTEHGGGKPQRLWRGAQDKGHGAEIAAWLDAVRAGSESPVPFDEAVGATRTTFAMLRALRTGRAVDPGA